MYMSFFSINSFLASLISGCCSSFGESSATVSNIFLDAGRLVVHSGHGQLVVQRRRRCRPGQRAHRVRLVVRLVGGVEGADGPGRDGPVPREERVVPAPVLDPLAPAVERLPHVL